MYLEQPFKADAYCSDDQAMLNLMLIACELADQQWTSTRSSPCDCWAGCLSEAGEWQTI